MTIDNLIDAPRPDSLRDAAQGGLVHFVELHRPDGQRWPQRQTQKGRSPLQIS